MTALGQAYNQQVQDIWNGYAAAVQAQDARIRAAMRMWYQQTAQIWTQYNQQFAVLNKAGGAYIRLYDDLKGASDSCKADVYSDSAGVSGYGDDDSGGNSSAEDLEARSCDQIAGSLADVQATALFYIQKENALAAATTAALNAVDKAEASVAKSAMAAEAAAAKARDQALKQAYKSYLANLKAEGKLQQQQFKAQAAPVCTAALAMQEQAADAAALALYGQDLAQGVDPFTNVWWPAVLAGYADFIAADAGGKTP